MKSVRKNNSVLRGIKVADNRYRDDKYLTEDLRYYNRRNEEYVYGNVALQPERRVRRERNFSVNENIAKNRHKARNLNSLIVFAYFFVAVCVLATVFAGYISLRSDVYNSKRRAQELEAELSELCAENDDTENRINGTIDLEKIKKVAMNDLGMTYADDSQIIVYESTGSDFVRQYISLEE